jgi:predicted nucleic acid-binding protein
MELRGEAPVISPLVLDELAYRMVLAWLRDAGDTHPLTTFRGATADVMRRMRRRLARVWQAIDDLAFELVFPDRQAVQRALRLMADPGLAPRDAFHAAQAIESDCVVIVSADPAYDRVPMLRRLGPMTPRS